MFGQFHFVKKIFTHRNDISVHVLILNEPLHDCSSHCRNKHHSETMPLAKLFVHCQKILQASLLSNPLASFYKHGMKCDSEDQCPIESFNSSFLVHWGELMQGGSVLEFGRIQSAPAHLGSFALVDGPVPGHELTVGANAWWLPSSTNKTATRGSRSSLKTNRTFLVRSAPRLLSMANTCA